MTRTHDCAVGAAAQGHLLWVDCSAGASGDMLLGALIDLGVPLPVMQDAVSAVLGEVRLEAHDTARHGIAATQVDVVPAGVALDDMADPGGAGRAWAQVRGLLEEAHLDPQVRSRALAVFARLARAEGAAHRVSLDEVHFHEVGGHDAIADVVGACAGLAWLSPGAVVTSPVAVGSGQARGLHGGIPVPGPAVLALLAEAGAPVLAGAAAHEACTPTGAALLAEWTTSWGPIPLMIIRGTGAGAGGRDVAEVPNVLRLIAGVAPAPARSAELDGVPDPVPQVLVECNVDDLDPRLWPAVLAQLMAVGVADAWLTPILMKKGRPAHTLSVLASPVHAPAAREIMLTRTSAIGLRESTVAKRALERHERVVEVWGSPVRVKIALMGGEVVNVQPEYDDVAAAASASGRSEKAALAQAVAAAHRRAP